MMQMIEKFAKAHGLLWGVCDASPLLQDAPQLAQANTPFVPSDWCLRTDPRQTLASAQSIVVLGVPYVASYSQPTDQALRGQLSVGAVGEDYHTHVARILEQLMGQLLLVQPFEWRLFVDNGPLVERALGQKAGLGFYGKNASLISLEKGSFFHIGYAITSIKLPVKHYKKNDGVHCGTCRKCVDVCPGHALDVGKSPMCNPHRCVSYLTQKKVFSPRMRWFPWVHGCMGATYAKWCAPLTNTCYKKMHWQ